MIKNLPMFDKSASVKKTHTRRSLIFTKFWVFSHTYSIIVWKFSTRQQLKRGGGEAPFSWYKFAWYLLMWVHFYWFLTVTCPCVASISLNYNQQDSTFSQYISINCSTCFRRFLRPSSGAQNCTYSVWYCQTNTVACCYRGWDGTQSHPR